MKINNFTVRRATVVIAVMVFSAYSQDDPGYKRSSAVEPAKTATTALRAGSLAPGSVFTVNNSGDASDANPGDGICEATVSTNDCTLRAAIEESNALPGTDSINFDESISLIETNTQILIDSPLNLIGNGPDALTVKNVGAPSISSRIFNISNNPVTISGMTITGGNLSSGNGGGIQNSGDLTISGCVITQNTTVSIGGGIRSSNSLTLVDSTVSFNSSTNSSSGGISFSGPSLTILNSTVDNNSAEANGGGANIAASDSVLIINSTFSNNVTQAASGGFFLTRGTIINTTISGNQSLGPQATHGGGGVRIQAGSNMVAFISSTITNNSAPNGGGGTRNGIWHETGTVTLTNTIVAGNATQDITADGGSLTSEGFNLIGINTSVESQFPAGLPSGTDYVGTAKSPLSPMLAPLADNDGPTMTHLPLDNSPAIDKGSAAGLIEDQRALLRTVDLVGVPNTPTGDGTDIGSVERLSTPSTGGVTISGTVNSSDGRAVGNATIVLDGVVQRITRTSSFGRFRIENVPANHLYIISVRSKGIQFDTVNIVPTGNIDNIEITALP